MNSLLSTQTSTTTAALPEAPDETELTLLLTA